MSVGALRRHCAAFATSLRTETGQSAVEFALVSVTLLLFIAGALDLGRAVYYYDVLANSSRDGARLASVTSGGDWQIAGNQPGTYGSAQPYLGSKTIVGAAAAPSFGLDPTSFRVTISAPMGTVSGFELPITVATSYVYQPLATGLLGMGAVTITASSTMHMR